MFYRIASIATALALTVSPAMAWDNTNTGSGQIVDQGGAGAQSHARASAHAGARVSGVTGGAGGAGGTGYGGYAQGGSASATGGSVTVNGGGFGGGSGGGRYGDIPPASAIAPSFYNGGNPCLGAGASAAGQTPVFGLSFGGQQMDEVCRARMLGEQDTAREVMCQDSRSFRRAAYTVGRPCADDRVKWSNEHQTAPAPVKFVPSPWCEKASAIERKYNPGSCGAN